MAKKNFFNLTTLDGGIERKLAAGIDTSIFVGDQAMISVVQFEPGSVGDFHSHREEQWGFCQQGHGIRIQAGERIEVKAGDFWLTPGDVEHGMEAGDEGMKVIDVFAPPRGSYTVAGSGFSGDNK